MHQENLPGLLRRFFFRNCSLILLVCWSIDSISATEEGWELRLEKDGIRVESRLEPGKQHQSFRATVDIEAGQAAIVALLQDNAACTEWLHRCVESHAIEEISQTERTFYQVTDLPFPVKSRDVIFHATIGFREDRSVLIKMESRPDLLETSRHVRIEDAYGSYLLENMPGNGTRVTWQQYVDPAGALPAWLVNGMLTDLPFKSLLALRELVSEPPYRDARFIFDANGQPIALEQPG